MKKRLFLLLCALTVVFLCLAVSAAGEDYMTFAPYGIYKTATPLSTVPATYEAWVKIPAGRTFDSGNVIANSSASHYSSFQWHIYDNSAPMIKFINKVPDGVGSSKTYTFSESSVATGEWTHIAIVADAQNQTIGCYINGALSESKSFTFVPEVSPLPLVLGGDNHSGNDDYFKGQIRSVTLYADVRTPAEIAADMTAVDTADANLLAHYDLRTATYGETVEDQAGNYDMLYDPFWYAREEVTDFAYSMALIGDQQVVTHKYPSMLHEMYDWLLANKTKHKIEYVVALGDLTDNFDNVSQWTLASEQFQRLGGTLPLIACRGNHDYSDPFNNCLNYAAYTANVGGRYAGRLDNHYKTAHIGNTDYLFIVLDFGPDDDELAWACEVTAAHPNHKVIVITHGYMTDDGTLLDAHDGAAPTKSSASPGFNNGPEIWEKYVRKYENIVMVLSGHIDSDEARVVKAVGDHGNVVSQMLVNPQGIDIYTPSGMLAMLYFNEAGNKITVDLYSTFRSLYYGKDTRYSVYVGERSGDCNGDGAITTVDALAAVSAMLGKAEYKNADVDGDGKVTMRDALTIMQTAAKGA